MPSFSCASSPDQGGSKSRPRQRRRSTKGAGDSPSKVGESQGVESLGIEWPDGDADTDDRDSMMSPPSDRKKIMRRGLRYGAAVDVTRASGAEEAKDRASGEVAGTQALGETKHLTAHDPDAGGPGVSLELASYDDRMTAGNNAAVGKDGKEISAYNIKVQRYMTHPITTVFILTITIWALFGSDIQAASFHMDTDTAMEWVSGTLFFLFIFELIINSITLDSYFGSFFMVLDLIAALSMILDIKSARDVLIDTGDQDLTWARAGRAAKAGTRAGKMLKLTRVLRLFRMIKLFRMLKRDRAETEEQEEERQQGVERADGVGARISEVITNKVVLGVLLMLLTFPLLEHFPEDQSMQYGLKVLTAENRLDKASPPVNGSGAVAAFWARYPQLLRLELRGELVVAKNASLALLRDTERMVVCVAESASAESSSGSCAVFDDKDGSEHRAIMSILTTAFVIIVLSIASISLGRETTDFANSICEPLTELAHDVERIMNFEFFLQARQEQPPADSPKALKGQAKQESGHHLHVITVMQRQFVVMAAGLQAFAKFVPEKVVRSIVRPGAPEARIGASPREMSFFFCDIQGFTTICEKLEPEDLRLLLSEFFKEMSAIITASGGTLIEYIGDAILAVWNAPETVLDHSYVAVEAVAQMQVRLSVLVPKWLGKGYPLVLLRTGLHTGPALAGYIGSESRMKYGVCGPHVEVASHLEEINKGYGTFGLISENMHRQQKVRDSFLFRCVDRVVAGRGGPAVGGGAASPGGAAIQEGDTPQAFRVYETLAPKTGAFGGVAGRVRYQQLEEYARQHDNAMESYLKRDFAACLEVLAQMRTTYQKGESGYKSLAGDRPVDEAVEYLAGQATAYMKHPPPEDWDGTCGAGGH